MNREQEIDRLILEALRRFDGPTAEPIIHAAVNSRLSPEALLSEFDAGIRRCQEARWITGVRNALRGTRWGITDAGHMALEG